MDDKKIREGDIYKVIQVKDKTFEIKYGYYEEFERNSIDPVPIFPDLSENPVYTACGYKIVTQMQDPCKHFELKSEIFSEQWCGSCKYYEDERCMISVCKYKGN